MGVVQSYDKKNCNEANPISFCITSNYKVYMCWVYDDGKIITNKSKSYRIFFLYDAFAL